MSSIIKIKSGTSAIPGGVVKGSFTYYSASTQDLGPTSTTGLYSGIDAPLGGYTVYQIGGPNGWTARVAGTNTELNNILVTAGATGTTLNDRIQWASNTNSVFVNSGTTTSYYFVGGFTSINDIVSNFFISLNSGGTYNSSVNVRSGFNNYVDSIGIQSDGKVLVGGLFTSYQGVQEYNLMRLQADGFKDTTFSVGTGFTTQVGSLSVLAIAIQSDGKILVGGNFNTFSGISQNHLIRLYPNGSKDTTFDIGTGFDSFNASVETIKIQSDGKILVGGNFTLFNSSTQNYLIRLNSDGSKDTTFNIGTGPDATVRAIAIQSDGKILVGGNFLLFNGSAQDRLIRLNSDGTKDTSFNIVTGPNSFVYSLGIQSDGKILVGGTFTSYSGVSVNRMVRINSDASIDTSFSIPVVFTTNFTFNSINPLADGKIVTGGGYINRGTGNPIYNLLRLNSDGSIDTSFPIGSGVNDNIEALEIDSQGKMFLGGQFKLFSGASQNRVVRLLNYSLDSTFDVGTGFNLLAESIAIQSDGKILVGGQFTTYQGATQNRLIRINSTGTKDTSFDIGTGFDADVNSISVQSDGKILAGGQFQFFTGASQNFLIRLNSNGSKDTSFDIGTGFNNVVENTLAVQSDGKILVGGRFTTFSGVTQNRLIRLNSNGSRDTSFGIGTGPNNNVFAIAIQSDGKILVGGQFTSYSGASQNRLVRLNSDGTRDTTFDIGTGFNSTVFALGIQSDGKILVGGVFSTFTGATQTTLIRLNSNGSKDTSFDVGTSANSTISSIKVQSDGRILLGGAFQSYQGKDTFFSVLLNTDGSISNNTLVLNSTVSSSVIV